MTVSCKATCKKAKWPLGHEAAMQDGDEASRIVGSKPFSPCLRSRGVFL